MLLGSACDRTVVLLSVPLDHGTAIDGAAEFPDPASPVHRAVVEHRTWSARTVTRAFRTAGHPDPDEASRRFAMRRDGALVAGSLAAPDAARATLLAAVGSPTPDGSARAVALR